MGTEATRIGCRAVGLTPSSLQPSTTLPAASAATTPSRLTCTLVLMGSCRLRFMDRAVAIPSHAMAGHPPRGPQPDGEGHDLRPPIEYGRIEGAGHRSRPRGSSLGERSELDRAAGARETQTVADRVHRPARDAEVLVVNVRPNAPKQVSRAQLFGPLGALEPVVHPVAAGGALRLEQQRAEHEEPAGLGGPG